MRYVCISTLTTGLDYIKNDILEFAAIIENTETLPTLEELPKIRFWIDKEFYRGSPHALANNNKILQKICELRGKESKRLITPDNVFTKFMNFLRPCFAEDGKFTRPIPVAGRNYATFDRLFLNRLKNWQNIPLDHRIIDPGNFFVRWDKDLTLPTLTECRRRSGLQPQTPTDTMSIAWSVIEVLRTLYSKNVKKEEIASNSFGINKFREVEEEPVTVELF
jgi:hypothetical protein